MANNVGSCKFFWKGVESFEKPPVNEPAKIQCTQGNQPFKGEITSSSETDKEKTVVIDGAVKVVTVTDKVRREALKYLEDAQKNCQSLEKKFAITDLTLSILSGLMIGAGVIVGIALPALWPVALTLAVVGLVVLGVTFVINYREIQAHNRALQLTTDKAQWIDPLAALQEQRKKIASLGFSYAQALRGKIVSTDELKALFKAEVQNYKRLFDQTENLSNQNKKIRLKEFFGSPVWNALSSLENYKKTFGEDKVDPAFEPLMKGLARVKEVEKANDKKLQAFRKELVNQEYELRDEVNAKMQDWLITVREAFASIAFPREEQKKEYVKAEITRLSPYAALTLHSSIHCYVFQKLQMQDLYSARSALEKTAYDWDLKKNVEIDEQRESLRAARELQAETHDGQRFKAVQQLLGAVESSPELQVLSDFQLPRIDLKFEWTEPYFKPNWAAVIEKKDWEDLMKKCHAKVLELNAECAVG